MRATMNSVAAILICVCLISYAGFMGQSPDVSTTPLYNASGSNQASPHAVIGSANLSLGSVIVNLSGAAAYTSTSSYVCSVTDTSGVASATSTQNQSASQFRIFGTLNNSVAYSCIGN